MAWIWLILLAMLVINTAFIVLFLYTISFRLYELRRAIERSR